MTSYQAPSFGKVTIMTDTIDVCSGSVVRLVSVVLLVGIVKFRRLHIQVLAVLDGVVDHDQHVLQRVRTHIKFMCWFSFIKKLN